MAGMQPDAGLDEAAAHPLPGARVMAGQSPLTGEEQVHPNLRPPRRDVGGAADRGRTTADHDHRSGRRELVVGRPEFGVDLGGGLQRRAAPEPVGDAGRDDQCVVGHRRRRSVGASDGDRAGGEVHVGQGAVHGADPVQAAESVERDPVVPGPVVGIGQPPAQFLSADQPRLGRNADHVGVFRQLHRAQHTGVAEAGDDHPPRHARTVAGGLGTNRDTRSMTA